MAFFNQNKPSIHSFDKKAAIKLKETLLKHRKYERGSKPIQWPLQFYEMRVKDNIPEERIAKALDFLLNNMDSKFCPVVRSAKAFRAKFERIEACAQREADQPTAQDLRSSEKFTKYVEPTLEVNSWPKHLRSQIPKTALWTYWRVKEFKDLLNTEDIPGTTRGFVDWVRLSFPSPETFTTWWFEELLSYIQYLDTKPEDLHPFNFSPRHKKFRSWGLELTREYGVKEDQWDHLALYIEQLMGNNPV